MKIAPIMLCMNKSEIIEPILLHTGQHYDKNMSDSFFKTLKIPEPDINLGVGSGTHAEQTAKVMIEFEKVLIAEKPDLVLVVGDVNSTMACTLTSKKCHIKVAHVEAGLRSFDMEMPEEINRIVTDVICDYYFTTDPIAEKNLKIQNANMNNVFFVGNVMIDTLLNNLPEIENNKFLVENNLKSREYCSLTMHRPSNVENKKVLSSLIDVFDTIQKKIDIVFPIHPRTMKNLELFDLLEKVNSMQGFHLIDPVTYHEMLLLNKEAKFILTD